MVEIKYLSQLLMTFLKYFYFIWRFADIKNLESWNSCTMPPFFYLIFFVYTVDAFNSKFVGHARYYCKC